MATEADPYQVLGLPPAAAPAQVEAAYARLALQHHPDMNGGDDTRFCAIQAAYKRLGASASPATRVPMRATVEDGVQEHKMLTLRRPDGSQQQQHVWLRAAQGRCHILTSSQ